MIARPGRRGCAYCVEDELRGQLNELDDRAVAAMEADDEPALDGVLDEMWELSAAAASACPTTTSPGRGRDPAERSHAGGDEAALLRRRPGPGLARAVNGEGGLVHWDDVEAQRDDEGHFGFAVRRLGRAAGCIEDREPGRDLTRALVDARPRRGRGDLLRPGRVRALLAGREGLRGPRGRLHRASSSRRGAHAARRGRRARRAGVRAPAATGMPRCLAPAPTWPARAGSRRAKETIRGTRRRRPASPRSASLPSGRRTSSTSPTSSRSAGSTWRTRPARSSRG